MTRDEMRAECLEVIGDAFVEACDYDWIKINAAATAAFDALSTAGVRVVPIEATEGMAAAGVLHRENTQGGLAETFNVMAAVGDLTDAPEKKL